MKKLPPLLNTQQSSNYMEGKETEVFSVAKTNTLSHKCSVIRAVMTQGNRRMERVLTASTRSCSQAQQVQYPKVNLKDLWVKAFAKQPQK